MSNESLPRTLSIDIPRGMVEDCLWKNNEKYRHEIEKLKGQLDAKDRKIKELEDILQTPKGVVTSPRKITGDTICTAEFSYTDEGQKRIITKGIEWIRMLLAKNRDYGSSAWKVPTLAPSLKAKEAIMVRMSDKIERIANLRYKNRPEVAESLDDTIKDLGAYCLLYLTAPTQENQNEKS